LGLENHESYSIRESRIVQGLLRSLRRGLLLQALYTIRSNRLLVEQIDYNVLFRWFLGLALDESVWDHLSFSTNQERLIKTDAARKFLAKLVELARKASRNDRLFRHSPNFLERYTLKSPAGYRMQNKAGGQNTTITQHIPPFLPLLHHPQQVPL